MSPFLRDILIGAVMMIVIDIALPFLIDVLVVQIKYFINLFRRDKNDKG